MKKNSDRQSQKRKAPESDTKGQNMAKQRRYTEQERQEWRKNWEGAIELGRNNPRKGQKRPTNPELLDAMFEKKRQYWAGTLPRKGPPSAPSKDAKEFLADQVRPPQSP